MGTFLFGFSSCGRVWDVFMETVTVSPEFKIEIPVEVRESMNIKPGDRLHVFQMGGRIGLLPVRPIREHRGSLRGIDTNVERGEGRI